MLPVKHTWASGQHSPVTPEPWKWVQLMSHLRVAGPHRPGACSVKHLHRAQVHQCPCWGASLQQPHPGWDLPPMPLSSCCSERPSHSSGHLWILLPLTLLIRAIVYINPVDTAEVREWPQKIAIIIKITVTVLWRRLLSHCILFICQLTYKKRRKNMNFYCWSVR